MPKISRGLVIWLIILVVGIVVFFTLISPGGGAEKIDLLEMIEKVNASAETELTIKGETLLATIDGQEFETKVHQDFDPLIVFDSAVGGQITKIQYEGSGGLGSWAGVLINFLPLILFGALLIFILRQAQGGSSQAMSFGKSRARLATGDKPNRRQADHNLRGRGRGPGSQDGA
jgi:cell division protease FtsH